MAYYKQGGVFPVDNSPEGLKRRLKAAIDREDYEECAKIKRLMDNDRG